MRYIDVTGKTEEEAVRKALEQLHLERDDVSLEILERSKSGFLGIGSSRAKYFEQTEYGMYARMALIILMLENRGGKVPEKTYSTHDKQCKNPRCVTNSESYVPHLFYENGGKLVCKYCDSETEE